MPLATASAFGYCHGNVRCPTLLRVAAYVMLQRGVGTVRQSLGRMAQCQIHRKRPASVQLQGAGYVRFISLFRS